MQAAKIDYVMACVMEIQWVNERKRARPRHIIAISSYREWQKCFS